MALGVLWISTSDLLAPEWLGIPAESLRNFQLYKGSFYVFATAVLFYFLVRRLLNQISEGQEEVEWILSSPLFSLLKVNEKLEIESISASLRRKLNYPFRYLEHKSLSVITLAEDRKRLKELASLAPGENMTCELRLLDQGDESHFFAFNAVAREKNNQLHYIILVEDISERKKFLQETEAQNQRFRKIAWIQSHLVRAPLARIKELNQVLREGDCASSEEELIYRQALHRSVDELDSIVY